MNRVILLNLVLLLVVSCPAEAGTITVKADGTGDYPTIQAAIDAAVNGDEVIAEDGRYTGPNNRNIDFLGKVITVRSENGPENCIIDCNGAEGDEHRGFYFHNEEDGNSILDGFTITGGYLKSDGGGGIYCFGSSPTIINCAIKSNLAGWGGGILCWQAERPTISNCVIMGNTANWEYSGWGGGICCAGGKLNITGCTITGNVSKGWTFASGGGIACTRSEITVANCTITGNSAEHTGGGVACHSKSNMVLNNCILWDNMADQSKQLCVGRPELPDFREECILTVSYSDVQDGQGDIFVKTWSTLNWNEGNIDADPCFVEWGYWADVCDPNIIVEPNDPNAIWIEGDYHLLGTSPCIDAGDPNYVAGPNETDLDGNPRIVDGDNDGNSVVDMGAYERMPEPAEMIVELLEEVGGLELPSGIENGLEAKLNAALGALEDENENNDAAAVNTLQAFINVVEAQRGKKIPQAEADDLIAAAEEIIELLSDELINGTVFEGTDVTRVRDKGSKNK